MNPAPSADLSRVEWRVDGKPNGDRCRYVAYLDAAYVGQLLDEWIGPENWSNNYENGNIDGKFGLWAVVSVRNEHGEWVSKKDIGIPTQFEGVKGAASDAFKRVATLKWGVGRNVYQLPTIWAPCRVDHKGNAWPVDGQTLPAIHKELKRLGVEGASGGRVAGSEPEPTDEPVKRAPAKSAPPKDDSPTEAQLKFARDLGTQIGDPAMVTSVVEETIGRPAKLSELTRAEMKKVIDPLKAAAKDADKRRQAASKEQVAKVEEAVASGAEPWDPEPADLADDERPF